MIIASGNTKPSLRERLINTPTKNRSKHKITDRKIFVITYINFHFIKRLLHKKRKEVVRKETENIKYFKDSSSLKSKLCPVAPYKTNKNKPTPTRQEAYK